MNIYSAVPLIATLAYIPLLVTTVCARQWSARHRLFLIFLISAMTWSLSDFIFRSMYFPAYNRLIIAFVLVSCFWMIVQLHCFTSSFFPAGRSRWLPFAYSALGLNIILAFLGYLPGEVITTGTTVYADYGVGIYSLAVPMLVLFIRNLYIFMPRLKNQPNPVIYNQTMTILICLGVLAVFLISALTPLKKDFPVSHVGNIINAMVLAYGVVNHQLLDIRFVIRRGLIWFCVFTAGLASFWVMLLVSHSLLNTEFTFRSVFASTLSGIVALAIIYKFHAIVSRVMGMIFHGESYNYRQRLVEFAGTLHNIFSLKEQGRELLSLLTRSVGCRNAALLFPGPGGDFEVQIVEPVGKNREYSLANLVFKSDDPIIEYLKRERRSLTRESLSLLPEFLGLWQQEKDIIKSSGIELFMPLISRDRLIGIIILDSKKNGRYNLEDHNLLEQVTKKVAVSMEKEYLWEQLQEREEELSVINRSNSIIASSLDIQKIYDNFINELKRIVEVDWAAIAVIEKQEAKFIAISAETDSPRKINEKFPIKGTAIEWVAKHQRLIQEPDLKKDNRFVAGESYLQHSVRSVVHLPLVISNRVIGALIVASRKPEAYNSRQITLLEQLASQIAMPIENACLYARTEHLARVDSLTGLLNRRSLDEILSNEIGRHSRYGGSFSLIILDLDLFKSFNDTFGHLAGDELLRQIGAIMKNTVREADQAFRYGGDEFAILLPQTSPDAALKVAERIRQQTFATVEIESKPISISLGVASWPADGLSPEEVLASADAALYQAKKSGGNHTVCSQLDFRSPDRKNISGCLKGSQVTDDVDTIFALAATVDARDRFAHDHAKQVHNYATAMGRELGMNPQEIEHLGNCALLHDVGKIGISNDILQKSETLTESEWEIIKSHPALGAAIISHCSQLSSCVDPVLHHHEKFDGGGYPDGLKGEEIPLESRILAIADTFAVLTSEHVYSQALTYEVAIDEIKKGAGTQFDSKLVEVFLKIVPRIIVSLEETKIRIENN